MLPATFAMAPRHRFRLTGGHEAYGAAEAAAFELIAHAAELSASELALHGNKILGKPVFLRLAGREILPPRFKLGQSVRQCFLFTTGGDYVNQIALETDEGSERIKAASGRITSGLWL